MEKKELQIELNKVINEFVKMGYKRKDVVKQFIDHLEAKRNVIS